MQIDRRRKSYFESSGLISGGSVTSVTIKGDGTSHNSGAVITGTKTYAELTEEEKRRFLELQRKDEEESKSQWGDGTYEQKIRYQNSKSESTFISGGGRGSEYSEGHGGSIANTNRGSSESGGVVRNEYSNSKSTGSTVMTAGGATVGESSGTSSFTNVNRGPTFTVGTIDSGSGLVHNEYESKGTSSSSGSTVYTGSSRGEISLDGSSSTSSNTGGGGGHKVVAQGGSAGSSSMHSSNVDQFQGSNSGMRYGSSVSGAYGAAHFAESDIFVGGSSATGSVAGASSSHRETGSGSSFRGASSGGAEASADFHGGSTGYSESSSVNVEAESQHGGQSITGVGSQRGWSSSGSGQETSSLYENRGGANFAGAGGSWTGGSAASGGSWNAGGKNYTSFHESEKSHMTNTTWGSDGGLPRTYVKDQWRTNDDGYVRNGSSSHVEDGTAAETLDYRGVVRKMNSGGTTNVVSSNIPGDDSDLQISLSGAGADWKGHQNQGFRKTNTDESVTVQKWRTVDGKLYKVNNVDDWNSLLTNKDASTQVYEAQDYSPQDYRKPNNNGQRQDVDGKFKLYTRFKRDTQTKQCGPTRCATVKCKIGPLSKDQEVWLSFRSRAWVNTLKKVYGKLITFE